MELLRVLLIAMLAIPVVTAVVVALLGPARGHCIRLASLGAVVVDLVLAVVLARGFIEARKESPPPESKIGTATFLPEIVPGADAKDPHKTTWRLLSFGKLG